MSDHVEAALRQLRDQFIFYAREHEAAGKHEKAATNRRFADIGSVALGEPQAVLSTHADAAAAVAKTHYVVPVIDRAKAIEQVFSEEIVEQAARLGIHSHGYRSMGQWRDDVRKAALLGAFEAEVRGAGDGPTCDSGDYNHAFYGILNKQGQFRTPLVFDSEGQARQHIADFFRNDPDNRDKCLRTHKIVPVRVQLSLAPPATKEIPHAE